MLVCWLPYFGCIQDLELDYVQPSCCRSFSSAKVLPNPKLKKIKENIFFFMWDPQVSFISFLGPFQPRNNLFFPGFNFIYPN